MKRFTIVMKNRDEETQLACALMIGTGIIDINRFFKNAIIFRQPANTNEKEWVFDTTGLIRGIDKAKLYHDILFDENMDYIPASKETAIVSVVQFSTLEKILQGRNPDEEIIGSNRFLEKIASFISTTPPEGIKVYVETDQQNLKKIYDFSGERAFGYIDLKIADRQVQLSMQHCVDGEIYPRNGAASQQLQNSVDKNLQCS